MKRIKAQKYREIKKKLEAEQSDRVKTSLYLSKGTLSAFKKACGKISPSRMLEELMAEFIESTR
jgi:hypothetical protein